MVVEFLLISQAAREPTRNDIRTSGRMERAEGVGGWVATRLFETPVRRVRASMPRPAHARGDEIERPFRGVCRNMPKDRKLFYGR